jgi:hypothetical protein
MKKEEKPEDINELLQKIAIATAVSNSNEVSQPSSNIELTNKVVDTLFNSVKRKMLGILNRKQIAGIKKLYIINDIIFSNKNSILTRIIDNEIDLSVSESGKGREQLVKLTKVDDPQEEQIGRIKRYLQ